MSHRKRLSSLLNPNWPDRQRVVSRMLSPVLRRFRLERFPKGIDNAHIDVALDARFVKAATSMVSSVLREDVQRHFWREPPKTPDADSLAVFRKAYTEIGSSAVRQARVLARPERVQLFQLAVQKLLFGLVDQELQRLRRELEDAREQPSRQQSGQSLQLHDRAVLVARNEQTIRYRAAREVMQQVLRIEKSTLRKTRKTILGSSWPVAEEMLSNPLLQLAGVGNADDFIKNFPFFLRDEAVARKSCGAVYNVFADWLPDGVSALPTQDQGGEVKNRRDQGGLTGYVELERRLLQLVGEQELDLEQPHAFDNAEAVHQLLGGDADGWPHPGPWKDGSFSRVQRKLIQRLARQLERAGVIRQVRNAYLLGEIYPRLGLRNAADLVYSYLEKQGSRRELQRRFESLPEVDDVAALIKRIDAAAKRLRKEPAFSQIRLLQRCAVDCVRYRYALKLAWWMYHGMDSLRLVFDKRELEMSHANGLLQRFELNVAGDGSDLPISGHVIIKADVRGSTEITAQMRARNLNPAAYFSRNLYDPINALLKEYGAEKVFVEGDAVILAIMEFGQARQQQLAVARACGLAQRILDVVEQKNAESRRLSLPMLELGLGIAYTGEAPTYLYDEGHKIMISPAINRADRLSSCDARLRAFRHKRGEDSPGVEIVSAVAGNARDGEGELVRYNVNGIELEAAAFYQLCVELQLRQITLEGERGQFHVGRYPDMRGATHWLVVRESPVRLWLGEELIEDQGQFFHEVVIDKRIRARVQKQLARAAARSTPA